MLLLARGIYNKGARALYSNRMLHGNGTLYGEKQLAGEEAVSNSH